MQVAYQFWKAKLNTSDVGFSAGDCGAVENVTILTTYIDKFMSAELYMFDDFILTIFNVFWNVSDPAIQR